MTRLHSLIQAQEFDNFFNSFHAPQKSSYPCDYEVNTEDSEHILRYALAGFQRKEISVKVDRDKLTVSAEAEPVEIQEHIQSIHHGIAKRKFEDSWKLDTLALNVKGTEVTFEDGLLIIRIPMSDESKNSKIDFNIG